MLETRELYKVYKPKKGVPVVALNRISLKFPEKGMIFLLGKSGSGKSTMLNLLGGLDKYDDGEIIIKGVSSKNFKQQYFDSYRNTYVGFIFQEYNVLDEFSVGANIALAIELQGRKATDTEIDNILREVDLEGYGNRKPNELSGGQKQRVAIARALVKNPEIIMADEPTGALDSNTGRQVFDTLKKLSKDKLVIIVSHDREFSEQYADRIIELADGNVISDVEMDCDDAVEEDKINYNGSLIEIAPSYHLTEEDRLAINRYIDSLGTESDGVAINVGKRSSGKRFKNTDSSKIKTQDGSGFKLIKSKLPMKSAFKIGANGLKYKKFKLVMTIILSCVAFGLFGLSDTFGSYNHINACTNSIVDSDVTSASLVKAHKYGSGINEWWDSWNTGISEEEITEIEKQTGITFTGVYVPNGSDIFNFSNNYDNSAKFTETESNIYASGFTGYAQIDNEMLDSMGYKILDGVLPDGSKNEIAISDYIYQTFHIAGYREYNTTDTGSQKYQAVNNYSDIIGKTIYFHGTEYTITAVIDTGFNLDRYIPLTEKKEYTSTADQLIDYALINEMNYETNYSLTGAVMVGNGFIDNMLKNQIKTYHVGNYNSYITTDEYGFSFSYITDYDAVKNLDIVWVDGEKTSLGEKELIVSSDLLYFETNDINSIIDNLKNNNNYTCEYYNQETEKFQTIDGYKVVGVIDVSKNASASELMVASEDLVDLFADKDRGIYSYVAGAMPTGKNNVRSLVEYCYNTDSDIRYELQNSVTYELDTVNSVLKALSKVFFFIGLGFAVFASLMLANFIGSSISYKKQEIGILRAIGSRSNDVFRIFFSESFIIAMINFVLSSIGVGAATLFINYTIRKELGVLITILNFGIRQIALLLVVSLVVAAVASFIPVKKIASKKPIDAIRNR